MSKETEAIEQLRRVSKNLGNLGETEDYTDIAIEAIQKKQRIPGARIPSTEYLWWRSFIIYDRRRTGTQIERTRQSTPNQCKNSNL